MSRALVPARVIEQVVLVVPFGVVPFPEGCELGDDRPALEAIDSIELFDQQGRIRYGRVNGERRTASPGPRR